MTEPGPCPDCGSAIFWWRKSTVMCANCHEQFNPFAKKAVCIEVDGKRQFVWYEQEMQLIQQRKANAVY